MKLNTVIRAAALVGLSFSLAACLQTREELRGGSPSSQQAQRSQSEMQQEQVRSTPAPVEPAANIDEIKELRDRIDILQNQIAQQSASANNGLEERQRLNQEQERRFKAFEEALKNMEIQLLGLVKDLHDLKKKDLETSSAPATKALGNFERGESLFDKKEWQEAILAYEAYRDANSKGKNYAEATYKIGVCFQELNMKDEAKAFYNEVIAKAPKSNPATKAKTRLKNIK